VFESSDIEVEIASVVRKLSDLKREKDAKSRKYYKEPDTFKIDLVEQTSDVQGDPIFKSIKGIKSRKDRCLALVKELGSNEKLFLRKELWEYLKEIGIKEPDKYISWLKESHVIYEPRNNEFKLV
jgi:hypothetical protein